MKTVYKKPIEQQKEKKQKETPGQLAQIKYLGAIIVPDKDQDDQQWVLMHVLFCWI